MSPHRTLAALGTYRLYVTNPYDVADLISHCALVQELYHNLNAIACRCNDVSEIVLPFG